MTKIGLTLFVVLAFAAEGPEWYINESPVTGSANVENKEELTLTDLKTPVGEASVKCQATLDGTVHSEGKDETTAILTSTGEEVSKTKLVGTFLDCTAVKGCSGLAEVWPLGLPWKTQLEGSAETEILDDTTSASSVGFEVVCTVLGIKTTDECTQSLTASVMEDIVIEESIDLLAISNEQNTGNCSLGGTGSGDISSEGLVSSSEGMLSTYVCVMQATNARYPTEETCLLGTNSGSYTPGWKRSG